MNCHQCGKVLPECDDHEPYPWKLVDGWLYCLDCIDET